MSTYAWIWTFVVGFVLGVDQSQKIVFNLSLDLHWNTVALATILFALVFRVPQEIRNSTVLKQMRAPIVFGFFAGFLANKTWSNGLSIWWLLAVFTVSMTVIATWNTSKPNEE